MLSGGHCRTNEAPSCPRRDDVVRLDLRSRLDHMPHPHDDGTQFDPLTGLSTSAALSRYGTSLNSSLGRLLVGPSTSCQWKEEYLTTVRQSSIAESRLNCIRIDRISRSASTATCKPLVSTGLIGDRSP